MIGSAVPCDYRSNDGGPLCPPFPCMSIIEVIAGIPGFRQPARARRDLELIAAGLAPHLLRQIGSLLTVSPDPDRVVHGMATLQREKPEAFYAIAAASS